MSLIGKLTSGITKKAPVDKISSEAADMLKKNKALLQATLNETTSDLSKIQADKLSVEEAWKFIAAQTKPMIK